MGFGSFGGGLAKGFTTAYSLASEYKEKEEKRAREKEFRDITKEELAKVGQRDFTGDIQTAAGIGPQQAQAIQTSSGDAEFDRAVAESATNVMRENAARQGAIPADQAAPVSLTGREITRDDAMARIYQRGLAVDPERAFDVVLKGMQIEDLFDTRKKRKEFMTFVDDFNTGLTEIKSLAANADADPQAFYAGAKKMGIDVRPVTIDGGKQVFEAYREGVKVGQFSTLSAAGQAGIEAYSLDALARGTAKFSTTPQELVSLLQATTQINLSRRSAVLAEREDARKESLLPAQREEALAKADQARATAGYLRSGRGEDTKNDPTTIWSKTIEPQLIKDGVPADEIARTRVSYFARQGIAPPNVVSGQQRKVEELMAAGKTAEAEALVGQHNAIFPKTPLKLPEGTKKGIPSAVPPASPAKQAIPSGRTGRGKPTPAGDRIPAPPPKELIRGANRRPNPAYAEWDKKYGERYRAQQR
jgi:hypothetical protein